MLRWQQRPRRETSLSIPVGDRLRAVMAGVPGRSGSHLSVWRERDKETVTSSTLQAPSSGATISEARGPRSGPACTQMEGYQHAICVRATGLHVDPLTTLCSRMDMRLAHSRMRTPRHE